MAGSPRASSSTAACVPPRADAALVREAPGKTIVAYAADLVDGDPGGNSRAERLHQAGVTLLPLAADDGRVDLGELAAALGRMGLNEILVEGGGELLAGVLTVGLIDEVLCCVAPVVIGGRSAPTPVAGSGADELAAAWRLKLVETTVRPPDVWLRARPSAPQGSTSVNSPRVLATARRATAE